MKNSMRLSTRDLTLVGVLLSIMLVFVFVPINIGAVSMAFMALIPVIVAAQVKGFKLGIIMGTLFGLCSLIVSFTRPILINPLFQNPLVSVFPRILIGVSVYASCKFTKFLTSKTKIKDTKIQDSIAYTVSSMAGTLTNTVLVLGMLLAFNYNKAVNGIVINWALIAAILSTNFVIEFIVTAIICPPISLAVGIFYNSEFKPKKIAVKNSESGTLENNEKDENE